MVKKFRTPVGSEWRFAARGTNQPTNTRKRRSTLTIYPYSYSYLYSQSSTMTERGSSRNVLSIPIPTSPNLSSSLTSALRTSILSHAGESHHPDTFASDISSLVDLRSQAATLEPHQSSLTAAYTYHAQLVFVSTKLPATSFPLALPWSQPMLNTSLLSFAGATAAKAFVDAGSSEATSGKMWNQSEAFALVYDNVAYVAHPSLVWERCNVLFALAALLSEMGGNEARSDGASIKRAVGYFQVNAARPRKWQGMSHTARY